jgi:hypothetical protein
MNTTVNLDDALLRAAKRRVAERGTTLTSVLEEALRELLTTPPRPPQRLRMRVVGATRAPAVDIADKDALYEFLDRSP